MKKAKISSIFEGKMNLEKKKNQSKKEDYCDTLLLV